MGRHLTGTHSDLYYKVALQSCMWPHL